jgi:hypothetical protein
MRVAIIKDNLVVNTVLCAHIAGCICESGDKEPCLDAAQKMLGPSFPGCELVPFDPHEMVFPGMDLRRDPQEQLAEIHATRQANLVAKQRREAVLDRLAELEPEALERLIRSVPKP